ncbi:hypothetical protein N7474_000308 [Penicillium riverlandense]|uniref:uncharacterized protein n=1 Tax=Penicillium riverlandense TaxID=1903569 RepID=UPI002549762D|nr:uncharacterized protein N7474_000308 [Penicillium riverlandense]KAJ5831997.1 hypothetical protein N7474_000308 [Penicillium riverlandense]
MTEGTQFQNQSESNLNMFPPDNRSEPCSTQNHVETSRSLDPRNSLEDYNRSMLAYTHRQMSSFVDQDDGNVSSGGSSRSSQSSVHSGTSNNGSLARQANGPPPTSASAAHHATEKAKRNASRNPN